MFGYPQLILLSALVALASAAEKSQLALVCEGSSAVKLERPAHISPLIEAAKLDTSSCSEGARRSILDLEPIVRSENVCSIETATQIVEYYERFVSRKGQFYWKLPKSVKAFFLGIGFSANQICEKNLEGQLPAVTKERISEDDDRIMRDFNGRANHLAEIIMSLEPSLRSLFIVTSSPDSTPTSDTISVNAKTKRIFDEIKSKCRNKFKPIYDKLLLAQVVLENVGFDYDEGYLGEWKNDFRRSDIYRDWFKVVFVCESALRQRIILNRDSVEGVTVLSEEELAELKRETGLSFDEESNEDGEPEKFEFKVKLPETDLGAYAMREQIQTFRAKHKRAKDARQKLIKRFVEEAENLIYIDQVRFGRIKTTYPSDGSSNSDTKQNNVAKKRSWIGRALGRIGEAVGVAVAYPIEMAILGAGWVTFAVVMEAVHLLPG